MTDYSAQADLFGEVADRVRARYGSRMTAIEVERVVTEYCNALSRGLRGIARMKRMYPVGEETITIGGGE